MQVSGAGLKDICSAVAILIFQYGVIGLFAYLFLVKDLQELNKLKVKKQIGNLYLNLDIRKRQKVLFGLIFFL